jgi:iron complex transport system ATP-binding protein
MLSLQNVEMKYTDRTIIEGLSFTVKKGECFGIIGPNGSGKTTLLKLLSGLLSPTGGQVRLKGRLVHRIPRKELARMMAVVSQEPIPSDPLSVHDAVMMGRYPYLHWYQQENKHDRQKVEEALMATGLLALHHTPLDSLSGGERQRVALARAMAQEPQILLLDEPTAFLDIGYQLSILTKVYKWKVESHLTVVIVLHDLNLAAQFCDRLLLLDEGKMKALGTPAEVLAKEMLEQVYHAEMEIITHPRKQVPQVLLTNPFLGGIDIVT